MLIVWAAAIVEQSRQFGCGPPRRIEPGIKICLRSTTPVSSNKRSVIIFIMATFRRRPLTEADLLKIREQWGDDRVVHTLLWEIARLRKSVRLLFTRTIALRGYIPSEIIVPDDPGIDRLCDTEPAITDDAAKKRAGYDSLFTGSERELKRKARETRS